LREIFKLRAGTLLPFFPFYFFFVDAVFLFFQGAFYGALFMHSALLPDFSLYLSRGLFSFIFLDSRGTCYFRRAPGGSFSSRGISLTFAQGLERRS